MPAYCLINDENYVMNIVWYDTKPDNMKHDNGFLVENDCNACIGWTYVDGVFHEPPRNAVPGEMPTPVQDPRDVEIAELKAKMDNLTQLIESLAKRLPGQ